MGSTSMPAGKTPVSIRLPDDLLERVRNAIWHTGNRTTITDIAIDGLTEWVEAVEKQHNKGKPFPEREGELPYSPKRRQRTEPKED